MIIGVVKICCMIELAHLTGTYLSSQVCEWSYWECVVVKCAGK